MKMFATRTMAAIALHFTLYPLTLRQSGSMHRCTITLMVKSAGLHPSWEHVPGWCSVSVAAAGDRSFLARPWLASRQAASTPLVVCGSGSS
jgi:hypothetical protein